MTPEQKVKRAIQIAYLKHAKKAIENRPKTFEQEKYVPNLHPVLVNLMSKEYFKFVHDIHWVAPKPMTYRVVLKNAQEFYLTDLNRSWVAQIEGKKYYLLNLNEEQSACDAIVRILKYGNPATDELNAEFKDENPGEANGALAGGGAGANPFETSVAAETPEESEAPGFAEFGENP